MRPSAYRGTAMLLVQVVIGAVVALISGIAAQMWKKRTGAVWALVGYLVHALLFFALVLSEPLLDRHFNGTATIEFDKYVIETSIPVLLILPGSFAAALLVMFMVVASLPKVRAPQ